MKITRYNHACSVLEDDGKKLVVDPGKFTEDFGDLSNIVAVVVTHEHLDHFSSENLKRIVIKNPNVKIFSTPTVVKEVSFSSVITVVNGDEHVVGPFSLHITGTQHAAAHPDWPTVENRGVRVNQDFYYGGDSLTPPDQPIKVLAIPISYAWLKMEHAMDYVAQYASLSTTHHSPIKVKRLATNGYPRCA